MASLSISNTPNPQISCVKPTLPRKTHNFTPTHLTSFSENENTRQVLYKSYFNNISSLCKDGQIQEAVDLLTEMEFENLQIGPEIYGELLQGCVYERAFFTGQQIHARVLKNGDFFARNEYIETKLLIFYAKCDVFDVANRLFSRLRIHNIFSWAAVIGLKCRLGFSEEALMGFIEMHQNGLLPDNFVLPNALKACGALRWIACGKGVHGYVVKLGFDGCIYVASSLIDLYGKCGVSDEARKVFDGMLERNAIAWNSMIVGYVQNGLNEEAVVLFYDMRAEGIEPTRVTISSFLSASANLDAVEEGMQGHALAIVGGLELDNILGSSIINFYSKVGLIDNAELVFNRMLEKDVVTWNLLISGFVQNRKIEKALKMCHLMRLENLSFDSVTLASVLSAAKDIKNLKLGKAGHCYCIRNNLECDVVVACSIVDMYAKCERIDNARQVFNSTVHKDLVLWNTLLAAYADQGLRGEALKMFYQMQLEGVPPNVISYNSVILGFLRHGQVNEAQEMFLQMQSIGVQPNLTTWTTIISGLSQNGFGDEAIMTLQKMQAAGIKPNKVSIISALPACTDIASLRYGRAIHGHVTRHNLCSIIAVGTSLVDMYAKCGNLDKAKRVFDMNSDKELPIYNAMISGYALHGQVVEALSLYDQLKKEGLEPDNITLTNILSACNHAGLVNEGLEILVDMVDNHQVNPSMEHYGCVVDLLSRCGNLDEAFRFITRIPYEPDVQMWGSLVTACGESQNPELGEYLYRHLLRLQPGNSGNYVAFSNSYAAIGRWSEVSKVRKLMKEKGLKKTPGCSWIHIGDELHVFVAGDRSHPQTEKIYSTLASLRMAMH